MATVNFTKPVTSDSRSDVLSYIRDAINSQARMFDGDTLVSPPVGTVRYSSANARFEIWSGSAWDGLFGRFVAHKNSQMRYDTAAIEAQSTTGDVHISWHALGVTACSLKHARGASGLSLVGTDGSSVANFKCAIVEASELLTINGNMQVKAAAGIGGLAIRPNASVGGWALGTVVEKQSDSTRIAGAGWYGSNESVIGFYVGADSSWWSNWILGVTSTFARFNKNVGINADPPAWDSTYRVLHLGSMASIQGNEAGLSMANNGYWNGTNWKYITTAPLELCYMYNGDHVWGRAASGTAGTNATILTSMKLDANDTLRIAGNLIGIGTAKTPASASAAGTAGDICWDTSYVYVCTATNTWKRAAIATW